MKQQRELERLQREQEAYERALIEEEQQKQRELQKKQKEEERQQQEEQFRKQREEQRRRMLEEEIRMEVDENASLTLTFSAFSSEIAGKPQMEFSDKIILPHTALEQSMNARLPLPLIFKIIPTSKVRESITNLSMIHLLN